MLLFLSEDNFSVNINKLQIHFPEIKLLVVCFVSSTSSTCKESRAHINKIVEKYDEISVAITDVEKYPKVLRKYPKVLRIAESTNVYINSVPKYAVFKLGVFNRFLNINFNEDELYNELFTSINDHVKPKKNIKGFHM